MKGEIARVLDVFYADPHGRFPVTSFAGDYDTLVSTCVGDAGSANRMNFEGGIIGWWGGDNADSPSIPEGQLAPPNIQVINAERLRVIVDDPNGFSWQNLQLEVRGVTSGAKMIIPLRKVTSESMQTQATTGVGVHDFRPDSTVAQYVIDLDDVTSTGGYDPSVGSGHFADIASYSSYLDQTPYAVTPAFIPGEDIEIQAIASTTLRLAPEARSATVITNSLFDSIAEVVGASPGTYAAMISSIRHLENLDASISGFVNTALNTGANPIPAIVTAQQAGNLSWTEYMDALRQSFTGSGTEGGASDATSKPVRVTKLQNANPTADNTFMPVNPTFELDYEGNAFRVSDIAVYMAGNAGLFGALSNGSVKNLELVNFDVESTDADSSAGALAGTTTGTSLTGVLVRNESATPDGDSGLEITGVGNVGGLVGDMSGGAANACAAAVYVASSDGNAGGLVGSASNSATITNSYSGGHTNEGSYKDSTSGAARLNVQASSSAGGLVGSFAGASISNCYSTCSASGANVAGGLVGSASSGSITNSYATGLAKGPTAGAFAGEGDNCVSTGNSYLDCLDKDNYGETRPVIGDSPDSKKVSMIDKDTDTYKNYVSGSTGTAVCYDQNLVTLYGGTYPNANLYPYKNISELPSAGDFSTITLYAHLTTHYGDWPAPGALVVNK